MKLKLRTQSTEVLKKSFSLISNLRKFVVLQFSPQQLTVILVDRGSVAQEPQVWCKIPMASVFTEMEILSLNDDRILLEVNIELFLQTLRNFEKANSTDFIIRLQRKEGAGSSKVADLSLYYSDMTDNASTVNHTFRIPVRILKGKNNLLHEPEIPHVDLMIKLPKEFAATYKRLEKFKNTAAQDKLTIKASLKGGGEFKFIVREAESHTTTISWNNPLNIQKPPADLDSDSLRVAAFQDGQDSLPIGETPEETSVTVKLKDWRMSARIVSICKTIILLLADNDACVMSCLLDDAEDVEVQYYISALRQEEVGLESDPD